ncbi:hypothetical protein PVK06_001448 [Gossypium arboreum]|uniref:Uncharacterized protein n=1 Tax=Gossypium arboreum TaxID=29729 RepID=A0ABR0R185_GOSAR|nr:hypothetical protein PVK06_001448 [Gossypium arboreum]
MPIPLVYSNWWVQIPNLPPGLIRESMEKMEMCWDLTLKASPRKVTTDSLEISGGHLVHLKQLSVATIGYADQKK